MSYDGTVLNDLNQARAALGDTSNDADTELLTDVRISAVITEYGYNLGVAVLAEELAVRYATKPDRVTLPSGLSVAWSERVAAWWRISAQYKAAAAQATALEELVIPTSVSVATRVVW